MFQQLTHTALITIISFNLTPINENNKTQTEQITINPNNSNRKRIKMNVGYLCSFSEFEIVFHGPREMTGESYHGRSNGGGGGGCYSEEEEADWLKK